MLGTLLVLLVIFGLVAAIEVPGLVKKKQWRELAAFSGILAVGFSLNILYRLFKVDFAVVTELLVNLLS